MAIKMIECITVMTRFDINRVGNRMANELIEKKKDSTNVPNIAFTIRQQIAADMITARFNLSFSQNLLMSPGTNPTNPDIMVKNGLYGPFGFNAKPITSETIPTANPHIGPSTSPDNIIGVCPKPILNVLPALKDKYSAKTIERAISIAASTKFFVLIFFFMIPPFNIILFM